MAGGWKATTAANGWSIGEEREYKDEATQDEPTPSASTARWRM
jgi:hypothetical protein